MPIILQHLASKIVMLMLFDGGAVEWARSFFKFSFFPAYFVVVFSKNSYQ